LYFKEDGLEKPKAVIRHLVRATLTNSDGVRLVGNSKTIAVRSIPKEMQINITNKFDN
jgi:hypothetical protein